jgi:hypothetical protein
MPASPGTTHNYHLNDRAGALRSLLNAGHTLRLFVAPTTLTPANVLSDFVEASFGGYAGQSLAGLFAAQTKVIDGEYQTQAAQVTFAFASGSPQVVYGWYISDGVGVRYSYLLANPVTFSPGVSLTITCQIQDWAFVTVP